MIRTAVLAAATLLALSPASDAHQRHHHHRHHRVAPPPISGGYDFALVDKAKAYLGETAAQIGVRRTAWCSAFLRRITGARGVDDRAISWMNHPHVAAAIGTIAVMRHHVGVVTGFDPSGNPIIVSGNHSHRVGEGVYPRSRILAYVSAT